MKLLILFIFLLSASCNYTIDKRKNSKDPSGQSKDRSSGSRITAIDGDTITLTDKSGKASTIKSNELNFKIVQDTILGPLCMKCHNPGGSRKEVFTNYASTRKWARQIYSTMEERSMPPEGNPAASEVEIQAIDIWVNNGAPE